jgi:MFS family permease
LALHTLIAALVRIATARSWGRAIDRFGAPLILAACSIGIAIMPLLWCFAGPGRIWPLLCDAVVCGVLWGGHSIASMHWPLEISPRPERPFYLAVFAAGAGLGIAGAALVCAAILDRAPHDPGRVLPMLFVTSAILRFACAFLALRIDDTRAAMRALAVLPARVLAILAIR